MVGAMSIWSCLGEIAARIRHGTATCVASLVEAARTVVEGDPVLRRKVAFSVAMIALSAKMAKADGIVTPEETRVFHQIFAVPTAEVRNVSRLYDLARADVAGFEVYAQRMARLCTDASAGEPDILEDVLDGLFHIAKADGLLHELEGSFLRRVADIFGIKERAYEALLARHVDLGERDPWTVLGIARGTPPAEVKRHYRKLVIDNHPDRAIARGLPKEFVAIANRRLAAINAAFETIERQLAAA